MTYSYKLFFSLFNFIDNQVFKKDFKSSVDSPLVYDVLSITFRLANKKKILKINLSLFISLVR